MTLEEYKTELSNHDWYYYFSDDHSVYTRGDNDYNRLVGIARSEGVEFQKAFNETHAKRFDTPSFVKPYNPIFIIKDDKEATKG